MHLAQGVLRAININKMTKAGCRFKMLIADWHAWANNKIGGNLEKIQTVGKYFIEVWKSCGLETEGVEFVWSNDIVSDKNYWKVVMSVARNNTVKRILRCAQIMGRRESESLSAAQIVYPCMQAADIFYLKADIAQLGMDQRKVNVLAREIGDKIGFWKPVVVSHLMLMGLNKPPDGMSAVERAVEMKMSKSKPDTAIFMSDSEKDIKRKINKAYCPERQVKDNPVLEYCREIIFQKFGGIKIERPEKFGGDVTFKKYKELEKTYRKGELHPLDLKKAVAFYINELLKPVRKYFEKNKKAAELLEEIKKMEVTR
jgi:tyrosyl-tRNA synthetase